MLGAAHPRARCMPHCMPDAAVSTVSRHRAGALEEALMVQRWRHVVANSNPGKLVALRVGSAGCLALDRGISDQRLAWSRRVAFHAAAALARVRATVTAFDLAAGDEAVCWAGSHAALGDWRCGGAWLRQ